MDRFKLPAWIPAWVRPVLLGLLVILGAFNSLITYFSNAAYLTDPNGNALQRMLNAVASAPWWAWWSLLLLAILLLYGVPLLERWRKPKTHFIVHLEPTALAPTGGPTYKDPTAEEKAKAGARAQAVAAIAKLPLIPDISDRTFAYVKALREAMIGCHGGLDSVAETDPEMLRAFEEALLDLKPLIEKRLGRQIQMPDTGMLTVSGVVHLAKDLELAAAAISASRYASSPKDSSVTSRDQSGGITAHTIGTVIQREPEVAPKTHYCYLIADTTDMRHMRSPYLWIHADGRVPPGSGYISPWGSPKGHGNYAAINKKIEWRTTSRRGFKTAVFLPPGDYSIDFSAEGSLNWEERLIIRHDERGLTQEATIFPEDGEPFSPEIHEH
jgi:hypothetical protein